MKSKIIKPMLVASIFLVSLIIILGCTKLLIMNQQFYHSQFAKLGVYENIGSAADIALNNILDFFNGYSELNSELFGKDEIEHMYDVRNMIFNGNVVFYSFIGALIVFFVFFYLYEKEHIAESLMYGGSLALAIIIVLFLAVLINFDAVFTGFHMAFFEEGTWVFPADSMLKTLFPDEFFVNFFICVAAYSVLISLVLFFCLAYYKIKKGKK